MALEQAPSLGELSNINADPEIGTGTPAVVFTGGQEMVNQLNENARFSAQQDREKYNTLLNNLKEEYARGDEIAKTQVSPQDAPVLREKMAEVFQKIGENPKDFFQNAGTMSKVTGELQEIQSQANKSKGDYIYDLSHRDFLERNPSFNTDENKNKVEEFSKKPLEERKPFLLDTSPVVDMNKIKDGILNDPTVKQTGAGVRPYGADGQYNQEYETTTYKYQPFKQRWDAALQLNPDINKYAQNLYSKLPDEQKKTVSLQDFWSHIGDMTFGQDQDITNESKGKLVKNDFALEGLKNTDRLEQIKASTKPALLRAYDYHRVVEQKLADDKTEKEKDNTIKDIWTDNIIHQKQLVEPMGASTGGSQGVGFTMLPAGESLPLHTFDGDKVGLLKPFNATPEYVAAPTAANPTGKKFVGWKGGVYKQHYYSGDNEINVPDMFTTYSNMRKQFSADKLKNLGVTDFNSFIKEAIKNGQYQLKIEGQNGSTDENVESSALRAISNKDTKKGQQGVFSTDDYAPEIIGGDGQSQGTVETATDGDK